MVQLELSREERDELVNVLQSSLSELRMEISATDGMEYRDALKGRREVLQRILDGLGASLPPESPPPLT